MSTSSPPTASDSWLVSAGDAAKLLDISTRHLAKLHAAGKLPAPVRLGRSVRWRSAELQAWLAAGCPPRDRWETLRAASR